MRHEFSAHITPSGEFVFDDKAQWTLFRCSQKPGGYLVSLRREGPPRKLSQNNAHWERCTILSKFGGASKEAISAMLMEECGFGERKHAFGKDVFDHESTTGLTQQEFWKLKEAAYEKLKFINEDRDPENYVLFPERNAHGIMKWCAMWEERPDAATRGAQR